MDAQIQTFGDLAVLFSDFQKQSLKESSFQLLNFNLNNYILPNFSDIPLSAISQNLITERIVNLKRDNASTSSKTKSIIFRAVKQILLFGMHAGHVQPMLLDFKIPDVIVNFRTKNKTILNSTEVSKIIHIAETNPSPENISIFLSLFLGLHIGELCALRWQDFNFDSRIVEISRTLQRISTQNSAEKTKIVETSLKENGTQRTVKFSSAVKNIIDLAGEKLPNSYILTASNKPTEPCTFRIRFKQYLKNNDFRELKFQVFYDTYISEKQKRLNDSVDLFEDEILLVEKDL